MKKTNRLLLVMAFMSMFVFGTSLYGQEIDPTWYNPWPEASKASAPVAQPQVAKHKNQTKIASVSSERQSGKLHPKQVASKRTTS